MQMTAHDKEVLERLGFRFDGLLFYFKKKQSCELSFCVSDLDIIVLRRMYSFWGEVTEDKYPQWVKNDLAELRREGVVK